MSNSRTLLRKQKKETPTERKIGLKGSRFRRHLPNRTKTINDKKFVLHATKGWKVA